MNVIIVIDPHPILRMGLVQLLKENFTKATIKAEDYSLLEENAKKNLDPAI